MKTHLKATSLSLIALGMLTSGLVACGDEGAQGGQEATGEQAASITARGIDVAGCGANGVFNVVSADSSAQNFDFIALDQSDFSNLTSQLSTLNEQNQQQLVSNSADTLDTSLQKLINEFTSNTTARQESENLLKEHVAANNSTKIVETASHSDRSIVTTDSSSVSESSRSGSASNRALQQASSFNLDLAKASSRNNTAFSNVTSNVASGGGGAVAPVVPIALGVAMTAPFFSSASFTNNFGSASNAANSLNKNVNSNFNLVASNNKTSFSDYARQEQSQHTSTTTANEWSRSLESQTADEMSRDLFSRSAQEAAQAASQSSQSASLAKSLRETHVAFQNLEKLHAKNFQLNINMQSADNQTHTLRVFVGKDNQITSMRNFAVAFPSCGIIDP